MPLISAATYNWSLLSEQWNNDTPTLMIWYQCNHQNKYLTLHTNKWWRITTAVFSHSDFMYLPCTLIFSALDCTYPRHYKWHNRPSNCEQLKVRTCSLRLYSSFTDDQTVSNWRSEHARSDFTAASHALYSLLTTILQYFCLRMLRFLDLWCQTN